MNGRHVRTLTSCNFATGSHDITFMGDDLPNGAYVYRLETEVGQIIGTVVLAK